jgi:hypothetical protein
LEIAVPCFVCNYLWLRNAVKEYPNISYKQMADL